MINNQKRMLLSSFNQLIQSISKPRWRLNQLEKCCKASATQIACCFQSRTTFVAILQYMGDQILFSFIWFILVLCSWIREFGLVFDHLSTYILQNQRHTTQRSNRKLGMSFSFEYLNAPQLFIDSNHGPLLWTEWY